MKRDVKEMQELDPAELDEVSGGILPFLAGAAVGAGAVYAWNQWISPAINRPQSATPDMNNRRCYGYDTRSANNRPAFDVRVCEK